MCVGLGVGSDCVSGAECSDRVSGVGGFKLCVWGGGGRVQTVCLGLGGFRLCVWGGGV